MKYKTAFGGKLWLIIYDKNHFRKLRRSRARCAAGVGGADGLFGQTSALINFHLWTHLKWTYYVNLQLHIFILVLHKI